MGRPIKKSFFGNLNQPPIGGEGVASVTVTGAGTGYTALPGVTLGAPNLPSGVQATATATELLAVSATVGTSGTGDTTADYVVGDELVVAGGATFDVAEVLIRTVVVDTTGTTTWATGDTIEFSGAGWDTPAVLTVTDDGSGGIGALAITDAGVYSGSALTDPVAATTATVADVGGYQGDATFNIGFGVASVTLTAGGTFTTLASNPVATTTDSAAGTGATLNLAYGVKTVGVLVAGSGYTSAPAVTFASGAASANAVLSSTNPNAIAVTAFISTGSSAVVGDIVKQEASRRYLVKTAQGVGQCKLVTTSTIAAGEMTIGATDVNGSTYYVKKLTARRAVLVQNTVSGSFEYADNAAAGWTLGSASTGTVTIASN